MPQPTAAESDIFVGESAMAALMRSRDWSATPLGPVERWPDALKVALRILLTSRFEMWLGWGPEIAFFYNDAYRPTLGLKHPAALGTPTRTLWPEIWEEIEPRIRAVYDKGEATWDRALLLLLERHGYPEETYHTFSYSPMLGDSGRVEGLFCAVTEETDRVISERRLGLLRTLAGELAATATVAAVLEAAQGALATNAHDLPFSLIYLFEADGTARLAIATGMAAGHPAAPHFLAPGKPGFWPLDPAQTVLDVAAVPDLPMGAWKRPPDKAAVIALVGPGGAPVGTMIVGLNPHRPADADYLAFLHLLAGQITSSLASADAFEAERRRTSVLAEAVQLRKEAAVALEKANARLTSEVALRTAERDQIWQASKDMLCVANFEGVFLSLNPAWAATLGWSEDEMKGTPFLEFVHPDDRDETIAAASRLADGVPQLSFENRYRHKDGSYRWFSWNAVPRADAIYASVRDVTEARDFADRQRQLEDHLRQAQKMEAVGQLTGGLAHDFNNLLTGITGSLDLLGLRLKQGRLKDLERYINAAQGAANRAAALTHRLLAFSRRQTLDPRPTNVNRLVVDMEDLIRRTVGPAIVVEVVGSAGLWTALVDPNQLENALLNLCINARDAMPDGGRLTIETANKWLDDRAARERELPPGQYLSLCVTDTGGGMTPEVIQRAFDPFFTTKPMGEGTGLGLSMIYGFARQSGGQVRIYSEVGHGTTMCIYLPRHFGSAELDHPSTWAATAVLASGGEAVLVVDDEPTVRMLVTEVLEDLGLTALEAADGPAGLKVLQSDARIDLLITDVGLPGGLNGRQVADAARALRPDLKVLFITGYAENAVVGNGHLDPGMRLLTKPFAMDALATQIKAMVSGAGA